LTTDLLPQSGDSHVATNRQPKICTTDSSTYFFFSQRGDWTRLRDQFSLTIPAMPVIADRGKADAPDIGGRINVQKILT